MAAASAAMAVVVFLGALRAPSEPADLTLESAAATSAGAFTPDFRTRTQATCEHLKVCDDDKPLSVTIQLRNCSRTQCTISAPKNYWIGEFPFTAADRRWSEAGPTGVEKANLCKGVRVPATTVELTLVPGDVVVDADGTWRANSLSGTIRRHADASATCHEATHSWNVTAKRIVTF